MGDRAITPMHTSPLSCYHLGAQVYGEPGAWRLSPALNAHKLKSLFLNMGNGKRRAGEWGKVGSPLGTANQISSRRNAVENWAEGGVSFATPATLWTSLNCQH